MHGSLPGLAAGRFGVIMFFSACRLPSFAPEDPPSHASENQITTGGCRRRRGRDVEARRAFEGCRRRLVSSAHVTVKHGGENMRTY